VIDIVFRILDWFETHPAVFAFAYGWVFGVVMTQSCKRWYPLLWLIEPDKVKRTSQLIATISAGAFCWSVWPAGVALRFETALLCGMSCPQVYTILKAMLPKLLKRWGFEAVVEKRVRQ
jgi:hypothetical protein